MKTMTGLEPSLLRWAWIELLACCLLILVEAGLFGAARFREHRLRRAQSWRQWILSTVSAPDPMSGSLVPPWGCLPSKRRQAALLSDLALSLSPSLYGEALGRLARMAAELGLAHQAVRFCRSRWFWRRLHGLRLMRLCAHVPYPDLDRLCHDRLAIVRAQVAETLASLGDRGLLPLLVLMLSDPHPFVRTVAQDSLASLGEQIVEPLAQYLETESSHGLEAGLVVAQQVPSWRFLPIAHRACGSHEPRLRVQAARLLGAIGGGAQQQRLEELLKDPDDSVRVTAIQQLRRLRAWTAAGAIAPLLGDVAWSVRREAALTLRSFGPPGLVLLRAALAGGDATAQAIVRHVLSLPSNGPSDSFPFEARRQW